MLLPRKTDHAFTAPLSEPASPQSISGIDECTECPVGRYAVAGSSECSECECSESKCLVPNVNGVGASGYTSCSAGDEPNDSRTVCTICTGNMFSKFGICESCPPGTSTNAARTQCNQIEPGQVDTDPAVLSDILNGTEYLRPTVSLELDVSDAMLVDGSVAQTEFFEQAVSDLATALGFEADDVKIIGIQPVRRRLQSRLLQESSAAQLQFEISPAVAGMVMAELGALLADPNSPLRNANSLAGINTDLPLTFNIVCPLGKHLPSGAADCERCPSGEFLNMDTERNRTSCNPLCRRARRGTK